MFVVRVPLAQLNVELEEEVESFEKAREVRHLNVQQLTQEFKHLRKVTTLTTKFERDSSNAK